MAHSASVHTDLGDRLLFKSLAAEERLGRLFQYDLKLISTDTDVDLRTLLGTPMAVDFKPYDGFERFFNGIVSEAGQLGYEEIAGVRYAQYRFRLVPKPWLLTQKTDCRIFKQMSVPDIVRTVLREVGYTDLELRLSENYPVREYCVQYREDYFNFISRLMEKEGIYYYFKHSANTHTMVLGDGLSAHSKARNFERIPYRAYSPNVAHNDPVITAFESAQSIRSTHYQLSDYDPLKPKTQLLAKADAPSGDYRAASDLDRFDFPGKHKLVADGQRYAQVALEALNVPQQVSCGTSNACGLATGGLFELTDFPRSDVNKEYLITATRLEINDAEYASGGDDGKLFDLRFDALESKLPFRSMATTKLPRIAGLQTAKVVGSDQDEDIAVDEYSRVQVMFHWDTDDRDNYDTSCPVRVASPWAGKKWGAIHIPRVGQEVVVSFLEGDPDRPLIIGSVYNADNMPPYDLPASKTQSGVKSRSLLGDAEDFNEIRFEDKKGSEELFVHAQKDMREEVENDHFTEIDHDETEKIKNDRSQDVGNNDSTTVGKKFKLDAGTEIELVTGASSIVMKSSGEIEIKAAQIKISGSAEVTVEAPMIQGKASAQMDLGAGATMKVHSDGMLEVNGAAMTTVKGATLMLSGSGMAQLSGGVIMIG